MFGSGVRPAACRQAKDLDPDARPLRRAYDMLGIDSEYDYDPVWQKCRELGIAPTFHTGGRGYGAAQSPDQLHLQPYRPFRRGRARGRQGPVPRRRHAALPRSALRLPRRRRRLGLPALRRPDRALGAARRQGHRSTWIPTSSTASCCASLVDKYGYDEIAAELDKRDGWPAAEEDDPDRRRAGLDDFAACKITRKEDWVDLYRHAVLLRLRGRRPDERDGVRQGQPVRRADQRDLQLRHRPFRRDRHARPAAGSATSWSRTATSPTDDFRDFVFANAVRLWGTQNPRFFEGTAVAKEAAAVLNTSPVRAAAD